MKSIFAAFALNWPWIAGLIAGAAAVGGLAMAKTVAPLDNRVTVLEVKQHTVEDDLHEIKEEQKSQSSDIKELLRRGR